MARRAARARPRPSSSSSAATRTDSRDPVRLLQLPLLRERGLPARLQLPAAAALGVHPRAPRARRAGRVPPAPAVPRDLEFGPRAHRLPRGLALPHQPRLPPGRRDEENRLPTTSVKQCRAAATSIRRRTATRSRPLRALRAPLDAALHDLFRLQNVATARATGSTPTRRSACARATRSDRRPLRRARRRALPRRRAHRERRDGLGEADLRRRATLWRINLGWTRRKNQGADSASCSTPSAATGRGTRPGGARGSDDPMSAAQQRVIPVRRGPPQRALCRAWPTPLDTARWRRSQPRSRTRSRSSSSSRTRSSRSSRCRADDPPPAAALLRGGRGRRRRAAACSRPTPRRSRGSRARRSRSATSTRTRATITGAPRAREDCEAACYDCLLTYANQSDHPLLDRHSIRDVLLLLAGGAEVEVAPAALPRHDHLEQLARAATPSSSGASSTFLEEHGLELPDRTPRSARRGARRAARLRLRRHRAVVFVDGPHHDYADVAATRRPGAAARGRRLHGDPLRPRRRLAADHRRYPSPSAFGMKAPTDELRAVGSLVRPAAASGSCCPSRTTTCSCCARSAAPTTRSPASSPSSRRSSPATFDLPDPADVGDFRSARLLRDALRLGFRSSAGPFRSFGRIAVEPRPYQLVPLLMALKLDPVRLLIADDVGIGKTVEALLIAARAARPGRGPAARRALPAAPGRAVAGRAARQVPPRRRAGPAGHGRPPRARPARRRVALRAPPDHVSSRPTTSSPTGAATTSSAPAPSS